MQRRNFIKGITLSSLAISSATPQLNFPFPEKIIKPESLKSGDTIGLIAPGSFITEEELKASIENIEALGFKAFYTKNVLARNGYLAGTDKQRADDLNEMFLRKDVNGVICARGGYGCTRILPLVDYELIKQNPKVFLGYSDVTALLLAIYLRTGLICFHGPVGISTFNEYSIFNFKKLLVYPHEKSELYNPEKENIENLEPEEDREVYTIRSGKASGKLIGGNLSIIVSLLGTPYDADISGKLIFIEETGEEPYRIDRMLTQLIQAGKLTNAAGIILGKFVDCEAKKDSDISFTLKEVLFNRLFDLNFPVIYGMSFGHIKNKMTLPVGINAELNTENQTITLLEKAVI